MFRLRLGAQAKASRRREDLNLNLKLTQGGEEAEAESGDRRRRGPLSVCPYCPVSGAVRRLKSAQACTVTILIPQGSRVPSRLCRTGEQYWALKLNHQSSIEHQASSTAEKQKQPRSAAGARSAHRESAS